MYGRYQSGKSAQKSGYPAKAVLPPPKLRKGCDMAIEFDLVERVGLERTLREGGIKYLDIISVDAPGIKPLDLVKKIDFTDSVMVRAGQMKITFEKETGTIRNISGGGCPDVPYLHIQLIDKKITEAPHPEQIGYTLCSYLLNKAFEEALSIYRETAC